MKSYSKITAALALLLIAAFSFRAGAQTPSGAPSIPTPSGDVRKGAPKAGTAPKIQIGKAETFKLDNGLTVIVVENHKLPTVSYQIFVDNDPVQEKDAAGYVEMMGELLSKGTKTRTKAQIDEQVDFLGASLSSGTNGVNGSCLSKHSDKLLDIMSDVLLNPTFPPEELEKAKRRQESGLAANKDDANAIAGNVSSVLRYGKEHPYGEIMTEESLAKVTLDQIKNHYNTFFKPNISYFVVVGDITKAKAEQYARQYFGKWVKGDVPKYKYVVPKAPAKTQVDFVHKPGAVQSVINITYPVDLLPGTQEAIKGRVANALFGGYFNSRINANLREGHGWTYGARSSLAPDKLIGSFAATASVRNVVTDSSIIELLKEMRRMASEKVPDTELQVVKNVLTGQFSQSLEQPGTVANFALTTARFGLPADFYEKYLQSLQNVSADDVVAMAKNYIRPDNAHILVVGNKDDVADRLKQFSADGKVNFYDVYGNPLKESGAVPAGMTAEKVIEDYVNAIGGTAGLAKLKDVATSSIIKTGGPEISVKTWQKAGKVTIDMAMNGATMSHRVYDGSAAKESGMGGARDLTGEELNDLKEQAAFSKEANYKAEGYKMTLKGLEQIGENNAYVIEVERPDGKKTTEYYDMKTSLKVREIGTTPGQDGQPTTMTTDFADYKEVSGVKFPHTVTITGVFPVPLKAVVNDLKVNAGIEDSVFK